MKDKEKIKTNENEVNIEENSKIDDKKQTGKNKKVLSAFKNAASGLLSAASTERNIRAQYILIIIALLLGVVFKLNRTELILVILAMFFVIFAEMINTAIEAVVDLYTDIYHPKAKIAKDIGAGAVVLAVLNSIIIAYFVFFEKIANFGLKYLVTWSKANPSMYFAILIFVTLILIVTFKLLSKKITENRFIPSGQAMVATSIFMAIWSQTKNTIVLTSALIIVALVCLNRISNDRRTVWEVALGGALGILIAIFVYTTLKIVGGAL